jgi:hypothetical protein
LLQNNNASYKQIAHATQLNAKQVNSALNCLQKRNVVVATKQKTKRYTYCAIIVQQTVKFNKKQSTAKAIAIVAQVQQKQSITQYAKTMFTAMLNKFKHYA